MQESNNNSASTSNLGLSISIIIAAIIVGVAIAYTNQSNPKSVNQPETITAESVGKKIAAGQKIDTGVLTPITEQDHIRGNINAKIKIVEYSDMECPYCIRLHSTLMQLTKEYSDIAWVYRHMPLTQLHPKAMTEAVASECVAELAGETAFFAYIDKIYANTPGNNQFDLNLLPQYAVELGVNKAAFETCTAAASSLDEIKATIAEGFAAGAQGTPFSIIITPEGEYIPVAGAQPIEVWRYLINYLLKE